MNFKNKKVVLFINGEIGLHALKTAHSDTATTISFVILNSKDKQRDADKILDFCIKTGISFVGFSEGNVDKISQKINLCKPDFGFSCYFGHKIDSVITEMFPSGISNLHISLPPLNRGAHPVAWAIKEKTAHGVTLHKIDSNLDTGDILIQQEIPHTFSDTAGTLYSRTSKIAKELITSYWGAIRDDSILRVSQNSSGSRHTVSQLDELTCPDLSNVGTLEDHLNLLRARTFSSDDGICVKIDGQEYIVAVSINPKVR